MQSLSFPWRAYDATCVAVTILLLSATACSSGATSGSGSGTSSSEETGVSAAANTAPTSGEEFDPKNFNDDSANVDHRWFPLKPGTRYVWKGRAFTDEGERIKRKVIFTVTDLTKELAGVRTVVGWDRDFNDGTLGESELIFFAQDKFGNVWHLGEYVEHWDDGELDGGRFWMVGDPKGAQAGIMMQAEPEVGGPSYSQGFAPQPWFWNDRARVTDLVRDCVPVGCFNDVLVTEEFEPRAPGAFQLKYYAPNVGGVRIGWRGPNEEEQEEMVLTEFRQLNPSALRKARAEALQLEHRAYSYGRTEPAQPR